MLFKFSQNELDRGNRVHLKFDNNYSDFVELFQIDLVMLNNYYFKFSTIKWMYSIINNNNTRGNDHYTRQTRIKLKKIIFTKSE